MESEQAINRISGMTCPFITPAQAVPVIGCSPQAIRIMAREKPAALGFPVVVIGTRTRIPRVPFLRWNPRARDGNDTHTDKQN